MDRMENIDKKIENVRYGSEYPFHAPDNYFEYLPQRVLNRVEQKSNPENRTEFLKLLKPALGLLVSFAIIAGIVYVPIKLIFPSHLGTSQKSVDTTEGLEFILTRTFSDYSLHDAIESEKDNDGFNETDLENALLASLSEYEIIQNDK